MWLCELDLCGLVSDTCKHNNNKLSSPVKDGEFLGQQQLLDSEVRLYYNDELVALLVTIPAQTKLSFLHLILCKSASELHGTQQQTLS